MPKLKSKDDFIPFGAQYYRAPTPFPTEWENDLKRIAGLGFNTVKLWVQWRWNNPKEGVYDFNDIDTLMDLAYDNGLKVVLNVIYDVAPAWFYVKHPDSVMVTSSGKRMEPTSTWCRQIGGTPGPNYHHPAAKEAKDAFTREVVSRYKDHPAMYLWDMWNEPELCYGARALDMNNMVCYSDISRTAYIEWLKKKYGTLEKLNSVWFHGYNDWNEVELPRNHTNYKPMIDWRMFFVETLSEEARRRLETARSIDAGHPVMVHSVAGFPKANGPDEYAMAELGDWFGSSTDASPFYSAMLRSYSKKKRAIASEVHAVGGSTVYRAPINTFQRFKRFILTPMAEEITGFLYWQYRPEIIGKESPAWGLTRLDGSDTPWLHDAQRLNQVVQENKQALLAGKALPVQIGIITNIQSEMFSWCATNGTEHYLESLRGAYEMFYYSGYNVQFVDANEIVNGGADGFKLLYYPFPYYMSGAVALKLKEWVGRGGILVSEAFFGGYSDDSGLHSITVPGFGFHEVFGAKEGLSTCTTEFLHSYSDSAVRDAAMDDVIITAAGMDGDSYKVKGHFFYEELEPIWARVKARFENGKAAVTEGIYGQGKAILIGTLLGRGFAKRADEGTARLVASILDDALIEPAFRATGGGRVRADVLGNAETGYLLIARNDGSAPAEASLEIPLPFGDLIELFEGGTVSVRRQKGISTVKLALAPGDMQIFRMNPE